MTEQNIAIYRGEDGNISVSAKLKDNTIWLTQQMMVELFQSSKANINEHISNIFKEEELVEEQVVRNFRTTASDGKSYNVKHYNLDMIISVGYRVKSKVATHFRKWATGILRQYLAEGYAINEQRLREKERQLESLKRVINLIERGLHNQIDNVEQAKALYGFLKEFSGGLDMLDDYDHGKLDHSGAHKAKAVIISPEEILEMVQNMKSSFQSDLFGVPKDESFSSSINQIYQTYGGEDCYKTLEEKAAMLLYLIVKNHSFLDGNKRIAAASFLYFLEKNNLLKKNNNSTIIDNNTLFSLTILIAESNLSERETIKNIVITILNRGLIE